MEDSLLEGGIERLPGDHFAVAPEDVVAAR